MDCLFCKIVAGEIPGKKVYEDASVYAFWDIQPQAPTHILIVPKTHIASMDEITPQNADVIGAIFRAIPQIAKQQGLTNGYRIVSNCGHDACQSVTHLHFHLLGGKQLADSMA